MTDPHSPPEGPKGEGPYRVTKVTQIGYGPLGVIWRVVGPGVEATFSEKTAAQKAAFSHNIAYAAGVASVRIPPSPQEPHGSKESADG